MTWSGTAWWARSSTRTRGTTRWVGSSSSARRPPRGERAGGRAAKTPMSIDIANEAGIDVDEVGLAAVARFTLDQMRIHPLAELSVLLVDERTMTELHERWMGEPGPTDVLAFPMDELRPPHLGGNRAGDPEPGDDPGLLGDVVLCPRGYRPGAAAGASRKGWSLRPG